MVLDLQALAEAWVSGRLARGELSASSAPVKMTQLKSLVRMWDDRPVGELDRPALLAWQESIGHRAPATRKAYLCTVRGFCAWLAAEGHVDDDPAADLVRPRMPRKKPRALPSDEVTATLRACRDARERLIVRLEVGCGLRAKEVSELDLEDYDERDLTLFVRGKFGNERMVPVPAEVAAAIDEYLLDRGYRPGPLILAVGSDHSPDLRLSAHWLSKLVGRRMAAAGVHRRAWDRKTGHALRHTCARDVLDECHDVTVVQAMLGHASLATTGIYLGIADLGRMRKAMEGRSYGDAGRIQSGGLVGTGSAGTGRPGRRVGRVGLMGA